MFRLISLILIIVGLSAAAYGGARYMGFDPLASLVPDEAHESSAAPGESWDTEAAPPPAPTRSLSKPSFDTDDDMVSITSVADDFMSQLRDVPIAHETPSSANFGRSFDVTVAIDATGGDSAADALPGTGNIVEGTAKVSGQVMAALSGDTFDFEAVTPMTQTVSPLTENVWRWRVTPTAVGPQPLVIELFAMDENGNALPVRTFRDEVEVEVSRVGQVVALVDTFSPVAVVVGGIGSFLAGMLGFLRLFGRRK